MPWAGFSVHDEGVLPKELLQSVFFAVFGLSLRLWLGVWCWSGISLIVYIALISSSLNPFWINIICLVVKRCDFRHNAINSTTPLFSKLMANKKPLCYRRITKLSPPDYSQASEKYQRLVPTAAYMSLNAGHVQQSYKILSTLSCFIRKKYVCFRLRNVNAIR